MFNSEILEVAMGLMFIFLIASLLATTVREVIEGFLKTRAIQLERGIRILLDDPSGEGVTKELFDHPLLYGLFPGTYDPGHLTIFWKSIPGILLGYFARWLGYFARWQTNVQPGEPSKRLGFFTDMPSYIPSRNFALALLHLVAGSGPDRSNAVLSMEAVKANTLLLPEGRLKQAMLVAIGEAKGDLDRARTSLEALFDGTMDRVSGWYKRETQLILLGIGFVMAFALNIDSLGIARDLATNNALRQSMIARVDSLYPNQKPADLSRIDLGRQVVGLSDVIGWANADTRRWARVARELTARANSDPKLTDDNARREFVNNELRTRRELTASDCFAILFGWILTALAISLGAPFWFDALNKFMIVRSTIKPYEKSPPEGSADRGAATPHPDPLAPAPAAPASAPTGPAPTGPAPDAGGPGGPPASGAGAQPGPTPAALAPITASLRLAFDLNGAAPNTLAFNLNGEDVPIPDSNRFLELPLETGIPHQLSATATRGAQTLSWDRTVSLTPDDEAKPLAVTLT